MRVIDGMHRLRAAKLRGREEILAQFFDGDEASSFILAVKENTLHGLPLSLNDRKSAARRIFRMYPTWSDRMVADVAGIAPKTVARVRKGLDEKHTPEARIGRDGRIRPINAAEGRKAAARIITEDPSASLREIALKAGISHETARDVRARLSNGQDPIAQEHKKSDGKAGPPARDGLSVLGSAGRGSLKSSRMSSLEALRKDPAFRSIEAGRTLLRMLATQEIIELHGPQLFEGLPAHCATWVADASRKCADAWIELAERIEHKDRAQRRTPA
jgi:hypothetical protein